MQEFEDYENKSISPEETDVYVSTTTVQVVTIIVVIILIPLLSVCGSVGNIISLIVLFHQRMRNQTNYLLAALCISDTLFLIHSLVFWGLNIYKKTNRIEGEELRAHVYPIVGAYGSVVTARITSGLTTVLCIERFVAVFYPMQARAICTKRNTILAIIVIYLATSVLFIPNMLKYEPVVVVYNKNMSRTTMNKTDFYKHNKAFYKIYGTCLNVVFRFAPLIVIPILNVLMIRAVHKTWRQRRKMSHTESQTSLRLSSRNGKHCSSMEQNRITVMLLAVTFIFFVCILPGAINSIATHIWPMYSPLGKERNLYICISAITFLLETLNSSVNFLIYVRLSQKFRLLYKEIFCCGKGEYYRKISISSVRGKFRWSSSRKPGRPYENAIFGRKTVSDIGPLRNDHPHNLYDGNEWEYAALSNGYKFRVGDENSSTEQNGKCQKSSNRNSVGDPKEKMRRRLYSANDVALVNGFRSRKIERSRSHPHDHGTGKVTQFGVNGVHTSSGESFHDNRDNFIMPDANKTRKSIPIKVRLAKIWHLKSVTS